MTGAREWQDMEDVVCRGACVLNKHNGLVGGAAPTLSLESTELGCHLMEGVGEG